MKEPIVFILCAVAVLFTNTATYAQQLNGLKGQVQALAESQGYEVEGIDRLGDGEAVAAEGDDSMQLKTALIGFSYVLWQDTASGVNRLKILGPKGPTPVLVKSYAIPTRKRGSQRVVSGEVQGPGDASAIVSLIVDTGATTIVLPSSMIATLGFGDDELREDTLQTVNGEVEAKRATLTSLTVGELTEANIEVSFVDDERVGGAALLGMSFLDRFKFTIDDDGSQLLLIPK